MHVLGAVSRFHVKPRDQQGTRSVLVQYGSLECMQKDRELRKVPRACQSTGRAGEAECTLQEPEAIGAELVRQASLLGTGTFGVLDTLRQLRSKGSSLLRPSAIRAGERTAIVIDH